MINSPQTSSLHQYAAEEEVEGMEEEISIAQKIEEVKAIVDLEKSKVEEEPLNENEQSDNREENTNNITSIEVPAANILTTDKSEIAILYEDVVNPNMPP